jgi:putative copper resistance protein D
MATTTAAAVRPDLPPVRHRVLLGGAGVVLAAVVVLAVTASETREYMRSTDVLGLDPGWAPWLVPVAGTTGTLSAVAVVGMLLSAAFLTGGRMSAVPALVWAAVTAVRICAGTAEVFGMPVRDVLSPRSLWFFVTEVAVGRALLVTLVLTVVVAVGCRFLRGADAAAVLTVVAVVAVLPPVASGHASSAGNHQVITSALMLHAASAVVWTGGLAALALGVRPSRTDLAAATTRFSLIAGWCFAVTVATGVVGAAARLDRWSDLASTRYGTVLAAKVGALAVLGAFGWWHRRRSLPALAAGHTRVFVRVAGAEVLVLAATMGLAVALSRTAPPNEIGSIVFDAPLAPALRWIPDPVLLAVAAVAVVAYLAAARRVAAGWSRPRAAAWAGGWSLLVAAGTVQFATVDPSGTVTVLQPLVAAFAVPALLVVGAPLRLARAAGRAWADRVADAAGSRPVRLLRRPGVALSLYLAAGFGMYLAVVEDWAASRHGVHLLLVLAVAATGCLFWSPEARQPAARVVVVHPPGSSRAERSPGRS